MPIDALTDTLARPTIAEGMKRRIEQEFAIVPKGKRGALILLVDERSARLHVAANLDGKGNWKVAAGGGVPYTGPKKPEGFVGLLGSW